VGSDDLDPDYLTRSDIARILKISTKQAGRLMDRMPTLRVGRTHRRVSRADFDEWRIRERQTPVENLRPRDAAARKAARHLGIANGGSSGSVFKAAEAMKKRGRSAEQHTQSYDIGYDNMSPSELNSLE
jgi:hypothetical protein